MKVETYSCDVCGVLKKETNHWYKVQAVEGIFTCAVWGDIRWPASLPAGPSEYAEVCGQEHVLTLLTRWLDTGTLKAGAQGTRVMTG